MGKADRPLYAPPSYVFVTEDAPPRGRAFVTTLMCVVVGAFGALVWNVYGGGEPPRIRAEGDYKARPPAEAGDQAGGIAENAFYDALEGQSDMANVRALPPPEEPLTGQEQTARPTARW